jgi:thiamine biosynthesis lipoprotein
MAITEIIVPRTPRGSGSDQRAGSTAAPSTWTTSWPAWRTTAHVTVTDPAALAAARRLVASQFAAAEKAAARFRPDAEIHRLYRAGGRAVPVSPLLAELIAAALGAAERTAGDIDPTVGPAMTAVHDGRPRRRDRSAVPVCGSRPSTARPVTGWEQVQLSGRRVQVPPGVTLDLSATAKAVAGDLAAARVRQRLDVGVLVRLGGDAVAAGPTPAGGWFVPVDDRAGDLPTAVVLPAGAALSTSHFTARPMGDGDPHLRGHLIDPRTGRAPVPVWRSASALGFSGLEAATYAAAALVRGPAARDWLTQLWVPARLVTVHDDVIAVGPWNSHLVTRAGIAAGDPDPAPAALVANPRRTTI